MAESDEPGAKGGSRSGNPAGKGGSRSGNPAGKGGSRSQGEAREGRDGGRDPDSSCPLTCLAGVAPGLRSKMLDAMPKEFVEHAAGAKREFLLALRSLIDEAIRVHEADLEAYKKRQAAGARSRGPQEVVVE